MFDISNTNPLWLEIPLIILVILGILSGLKKGIVRKIADLLLFVLLIISFFVLVPYISNYLQDTGTIQNFINQKFNGDFAYLISELLTKPTYVFISIIIVLLSYFIIKIIINVFLKFIFRKKGLISRLLGALWQLSFNLVFYAFLLVFISSPFLFKGGKELINKSMGANEIYKVVNLIQDTLKENQMPYDFESYLARYLLGEQASKEDVQRCQSTLYRINDLLKMDNKENFVNYYIDQNGEIKQDKASELIDDIIVFSQIINNMPNDKKDILNNSVENILNTSTEIILLDGNPIDTIEVTSEQKYSLNQALEKINIDETIIESFNQCLSIK